MSSSSAGHEVLYATTMVWNESRAMADLLRGHAGKEVDQPLALNAVTRATQVRTPRLWRDTPPVV